MEGKRGLQLRAESKAEMERKGCMGEGNCGKKHEGLEVKDGQRWREKMGRSLERGSLAGEEKG